MRTQPRRRRWAVTVAVAAAALTLSACAGGGNGAGPDPSVEIDPDGEIVVAMATAVSGLDPHRETSRGERVYWFQIYDRLTQFDSSGELQPMLATSWDISDDASTITFQLREDVEFHDGAAFNADAVVKSIERAKTIEGSTAASRLADVASVEAVGEYEVQFNLSTPNAVLPEILSGPAGAMLSPDAIDAGVDFKEDWGLYGTGPYIVEELIANERTVFVPAESTWDEDAGKLARLEIRYVDADQTLLSAVQSGEIDVGYVNPINVAAIKQAEQLAEGDDFQLAQVPTDGLNAILFRGERMTDPAVRQAIAKSVDHEGIANGLLQGTCAPSDQPFREGSPGHIPDYDSPLSFDPEAAEQLLADAGVEGYSPEMLLIAGREEIPAAIQETLSGIGVEATLTPLSALEAFTKFRADESDLWSYQVVAEESPATTFTAFQGPSAWGQPIPGLQAAIDAAVAEPDPEARAKAYEDVAKVIAEGAYFAPVCFLDARYLANDEVVNLETALRPQWHLLLDLRYLAKTL